MGSLFTATAQLNTSFESSEGFALGTINEQNGWTVIDDPDGAPIDGLNISDADSSNGDFSLSISKDPEVPEQQNAVVFAASPAFTAEFDKVTLSFDLFINVTDAENASDYAVTLEGTGEDLITSRIQFHFDNTIVVVDNTDTEPNFVETTGTWTADTWHSVTINYDFTAGTIVYLLDGVVIHEGEVFGGTTITNLFINHDNWPGSTAFFDNISVDETEVAGTEGFANNVFSVFPNPAKDVINIANIEGLNGVKIVDLNGRTVKSVNFSSASEAAVNVSDLTAGVYMMNITTEKGTSTQKIVKQ